MIKKVILYGSTIWSNCSADNLTRILKLQKRAVRVILGADTRSKNVNLFKKLEWLPFYDEAEVNKCSLVLKRLQGNRPSYMHDLFKSIQIYTHAVCPRCNRESELREGELLACPRPGSGTLCPLTSRKEHV